MSLGGKMSFLTKLLQAIGAIPGLITTIEGLFGRGSGKEKKDAVMAFLQTALSDVATSREIVDQDKFKNGLGEIIAGVVDCLNASVWAKSQVSGNVKVGS
jgi:hypothetical protein